MPRPRISARLSNKEALFAREYLSDLNATQAAIRAGYSSKSARQIATRLLTKAAVSAELQKLLSQRARTTEISAERVLEEIRRLAVSDLRGCFDAQNRLLDPKDWPDEVAAAIASVEVVREKTTKRGESVTDEAVLKVRTWDKTKALELLARYLKLLTDNVNVQATVTMQRKEVEQLADELNDEELAAAVQQAELAMALLKRKQRKEA